MVLKRLLQVFENPRLYLWFQGALGAKRARRICIREWVRPSPGLRVLDIGCGPGYVAEYFPEPQYVGFDIEPSYIEYAKKKYSGRHQFFCQWFDEKARQSFEPFDVVLMTGVIHHLTDDEAIQLLELAKSCLKPDGRFVALEGCYEAGQSRLAKFLLDRDRGQYIRTQPEYQRLSSRIFGRVNSVVRHDLLYVPYTLLLLDCQP